MACKIKTIQGEDSSLYTELEQKFGTKIADNTYALIIGNDFRATFGNWELMNNFDYIKKNILKAEHATMEEAEKHVKELDKRFGPGTAFTRASKVAKGEKEEYGWRVSLIKPRVQDVSYAVNKQGEPSLMYMVGYDKNFSSDGFVFSNDINKAGKFTKPKGYEGEVPIPGAEEALPVFLNVRNPEENRRMGKDPIDSKAKEGEITIKNDKQVILATQGISEDTAKASEEVPTQPETTDEAIIRAETEGLTAEGKEELENRKKLAKKAVAILKKKLTFFKRKEGTKSSVAKGLEKQILNIQKQIAKGEHMLAIMSFLEFAYSEADGAVKVNIPAIVEAINDPKTDTREKRMLLKKLSRAADYLSAFDLVQEIYDDLKNQSFSSSEVEGEVIDQAFRDAYISPVITTIREVKRDYIKASKGIVVDFLMEYNTNPNLTSDKLTQLFTHVQDDISWFQTNLDSMAESPDQVLALVDRVISTKQAEINYNIETFKNTEFKKAITELETYKKRQGVSITNYDRLYDFMLAKDKSGKLTGYYIDPDSKQGKALAVPERAFLKMFHEQYAKHQKMLPVGFRRGYQLIPILKSGAQRAWEDVKGFKSGAHAAKKYMGDQVKMRSDETEFGEVFVDEQGKEYNFIPIHYSARINNNEKESGLYIDDVSMNMGGSLLQFMTMAKNYAAMNSVIVELEAAKTLVGERDVTVKRGKQTLVHKGEPDRILTEKGEKSRAYERLTTFFDMIVYGRRKVDTGNLGNTDISKDKVADGLTRYTALTQLSLNLFSGINNAAIGLVMNAVESAGGQFYNRKQFAGAIAEYTKMYPEFIRDSTARFSTNWLNLYMESYDIYQDFDQFGKPIESSSKTGRVLSKASYFLQTSGEHMIQAELSLAMMRSHRLIGGEIMNHSDWAIKHNKAINNESLKEFEVAGKTVKELIDVKDGKVWTKEKVTREQMIKFAERIKGVYQRLHGNYATKDRAALQRYALGRMVLLFRKWLRPGWNRRYAASTFDNEDTFDQRLGANIAGNYTIAWQFIKQIRHDLKGTGVGLAILNKDKNGWNNLPEWKKQGIKRTFAEIGWFTGALLLISILGAPDDDDDEDGLMAGVKNMGIYQAHRLKSEIVFYALPFSISEAGKILKSPSASVSTVEKLGKALWYTSEPMFTFEFDRYKRGKRKGKTKASRYWWELLPYGNQIQRLGHTKESAEFMQNLW